MPQNSTRLTLDFAAIYQCAIKPFKHKSQRYSVCALLFHTPPEAMPPASDAVCSNYVTGKRAIPDDIRTEFATMENERFSEKFDMIEIYDLQPAADSLRHLVDHVQLPKSTQRRLVKAYNDGDPLEFLSSVFRASASTKDIHPLSVAELGLLASFAAPEQPLVATEEEEFDVEEEPEPGSGLNKEDLEWIREYVPSRLAITSNSFFGSPVSINRQVLSLPSDYPALIYMLKPALRGMPFDAFTFDDFIEATGINPASGKLSKGKLTCFKMSGPIDGITSTIEGLNLPDVSDVVLLMKGKITLTDAVKIEKSIRAASNSKINFIRSLNFDSRLANMEVTLIVRVYPEKAKAQMGTPIDADGVRLYRK